MTVVGTAPLRVSLLPGSTFDVQTPDGRARLLSALRPYVHDFSQEEHEAYNFLRDTLMHIARGEATVSEAEASIAPLHHFLSEVSAASAVNLDVTVIPDVPDPEPAAVPVSVSLETEGIHDTPAVVPQRDEQTQTVVPQAVFKGRRGPDIVVPTVDNAPQQVESVPIPEDRAPVQESVVVTETEKAPVVDAVVTAAPLENGSTISTTPLKETIEHINDELNAFAHGTAFKWLSDPKTGYRDYLNELLELRGVLSSPEALSHEKDVLEMRVKNLQIMAETVRKNVTGNDNGSAVTVADTPALVPEAQTPEVNEQKEETVTVSVSEVVPEVLPPEERSDERDGAQVTISPALEPLNIEPQKEMPVVAQAVMDADEAVPPPPMPPLPPEPEVRVEETAIAPAAVDETHGPLLSENEPESALMEKVAVPDSPLLDPLHTRPIDTGLNDLLTRWLGSTGFFGFGDSGVKHPDWLKMKDVLVDDVLHGDGFIPPGLRQEIFDNLAQNIKAWRDAYSLYPIDGESVEHYIRRVVDASLPKER